MQMETHPREARAAVRGEGGGRRPVGPLGCGAFANLVLHSQNDPGRRVCDQLIHSMPCFNCF